MTCKLYSLTALLSTLLCGCGGIGLSHRAVHLSVGPDDEVALVDGYNQVSPIHPEDPGLAPTVSFVDLGSGRVENELQDVAVGDSLIRVAHSPNGERLALVTKTGQVLVLDASRKVVQTLAVAEDGLELREEVAGALWIRQRVQVADAAWVPGQEALALSYEVHPTCEREHDAACGVRVGRLEFSGEGVVELKQEAPDGAKLPEGPKGAGPLACTPDGGLLLVMGDDAQLRAWTLEPFEHAWTLDCTDWAMPTVSPLTIAVSPDSGTVVVSGDTGLVCYDLASREPRWRRETDAPCVALAFAREGSQLLAFVERLDGTRVRSTLLFLDPATGEQRDSEDLAGDPTALGVTPSGDRAIVGHAYEVEAVDIPAVR